MAEKAYPLPFMIQSGGANYVLVERQNLVIANGELHGLVIQAMAWIVEALRVDARSDFRRAADEQERVARFLCHSDEYQMIRMREASAWHEANPEGTMAEFDAQFDCDAIDDSVRQPLPEWVFLIFEEGVPWATEDIAQAPGFRGILYVWNTRTVAADPPPPADVWSVSPNPMLAAPTADNEWWLAMFADSMHAMLSYELPLNDGRRLWLEALQFPTHRSWLAWDSGAPSGFVADLKQRMIVHGLELPNPVYIVEERVDRLKPPELGGGWMKATLRMLQYGGPLF